MRFRWAAAVILVLGISIAAEDDYTAQIQKWQKQEEARLRAPDGWLTVTGLFWLHQGNNSFGSAGSNEIVLPTPAPPKAGVFSLKDNIVTVTVADGADIRVNGQPVHSTILDSGQKGKPGVVTIGDLTMFPIRRGDRIGIRLKDKNSQARREFKGMKFYPIESGYRLIGDFVPAEKGATLKIPNVLGQISDEPTPGYVKFALRGQELRLSPVIEGDCPDVSAVNRQGDCQLFFIFKDVTSGRGTYPPGRFLYTEMPRNGKVILDFNQAVSPPCAWTPYATCPLPPRGNALSVAIEAGEMFTGHQ